MTDGWSEYLFLNNLNEYDWESHNHGGGDFCMEIASTSHIESLLHQLKSKLKSI